MQQQQIDKHRLIVTFYLPACDAVWLYLLQEYAELAFVLAAKSDHAESQAGAFRLIQLKKKRQHYLNQRNYLGYETKTTDNSTSMKKLIEQRRESSCSKNK